MGLAAGQARLLTITGRKSDCEFESMRLSHQKIALARELADLSNEYQNSLTQTKLYYDYYGTGDTSLPLSYNVLMTPSALNNYMPTTITDSMGRIALTGKLATAAFMAGIPQEGLGTLPSYVMRNKFVLELANAGLITTSLSDAITGLPYNQAAGFGGGAIVVGQTQDVDLDTLLKTYLKNYKVDLSSLVQNDSSTTFTGHIAITKNGGDNGFIDTDIAHGDPSKEQTELGLDFNNLTLADFLNPAFNLSFWGTNDDNGSLRGSGSNEKTTQRHDWTWGVYIQDLPLWQVLEQAASDLFGYDDAQPALDYASQKLHELIDVKSGKEKKHYQHTSSNSGRSQDKVEGWIRSNISTDQFLGLSYQSNSGKHYNDGIGATLSHMCKMYLTYFADYMNGQSKTDISGNDLYHIDESQNDKRIYNCKFVTDDSSFKYTIKTGSEVSSDDLGQATFYDALFNQICAHGWTQNKNLNDNSYLQQMLQSGMLYISKMKDDGYYYQGNYSTDTYIKEVADETLIAAAEAKYNTEKAKINAKEETLDMKMKNLDIEISALTTEYDSVKSTISKQIEKSFKRYSA